ncbi:MAG: DNA translocase FtsK 4TM domain-containing protein, partial [Casimicrobiaceae bacterium]
MVTWSPLDPAWSTTGQRRTPGNALAAPGAWFADIVLFAMGASVVWVCVFALRALFERRPRRTARETAHSSAPRWWQRAWPLWLVLLVVCSAGLEALGFSRRLAGLPQGAGGVIGQFVGYNLMRALGYVSATLLLICLTGVFATLTFRIAWLEWAEQLGALLLDGRDRWRAHRERRKELARDEALAAPLVAEREAFIKEEARRVEQHEPIAIVEPTEAIVLSERVEREKQTVLFAELPDTVLPPLSLLEPLPKDQPTVSAETLEFTSRLIERKLSEFNVPVKVLAAYPGPVITRYEIEPDVGVKGSAIVNLAKDLARAMSVTSIRVVETIPGKSCMGLEVPNPHRQTLALIEVLGSPAYNDAGSLLTLGLGKDIAGRPVVADLAKMPHCLVAGTTGSGKSVGINQMILSLLYRAEPKQVRLVLIDPKMLELSVYEGIPHLLCPVVTDMKLAANALNWCVGEMERRYRLIAAMGVRQFSSFNAKVREARARG